MKITKENFHEVEGKKIYWKTWQEHHYVVAKFLDARDYIYGINEDGYGGHYHSDGDGWEFWDKPKKKVNKKRYRIWRVNEAYADRSAINEGDYIELEEVEE